MVIAHMIFECTHQTFLVRGNNGLLHLFDCNFNSGSKSLTHISSVAAIWDRNAWPLMSNCSFCKAAMSRCFYFSSAVKQWTHWAQIFLFSKSFVQILNTDGGILVACDISLHVTWWSSLEESATSFTFCSFVDAFLALGHCLCWHFHHKKYETVLQSTSCSPQISCKALGI